MVGAASAQETDIAGEVTAEQIGTSTDDGEIASRELDKVIVTGSRLRSGLETPVPVTMRSAEQLQAASPGLLSEALLQLPVFKGSSRASNGTQSSARDNGATFLNLRGIGKERTLVLLDGRRFVSSSEGGVPDVNLFPEGLVKRVEIVTGGASAAYGSDAVSGVVNYILDTDYTGLKFEGEGGISGEDDSGLYKATLTGGQEFANGSGHILFSLEAFNQDGTNWDARDWNAGWALAANDSPPPSRVIAAPYNLQMSNGGAILSGPLAGTMFLPGGATAPYDPGTNRSSIYQVGGDGNRLPYDISAGVERKVAFARGEYNTGGVTLYAEGTVAEVVTGYDLQYPNYFGGTSYTIFNDNAFLSDAVKADMATAGIESFRLSRANQDWGFMISENTSQTWRVMGGFDWDLGGDWELGGYAMGAENNLVARTNGNAITRNAIAAADAVLDPVTGEIVCRSTLAGFDPGCVPMNLFGEGSPSQASIDYTTGAAVKDLTLEQQIVSLTLRGSPFTLPAGDVNIATGIEYRKETATQTGDPISARIDTDDGLRGAINRLTSGVPGGFQLSNPQPLRGTYDVKEFFVEADAPLVIDKTLMKSLSLNGAVRIIEYSTVGDVTTWKAGISYEPFDDLRLRATRSRDIRAANIQELFTGVQNALAVVRINGGTSSALGQRRGNPDLNPEIADTVTYGLAYQPAWLQGFGATVDYYSIDIEGAIQQLSNQQTVDQCDNGSQLACAQITTNSSGLIIIDTPYLNLAGLKASGVDLELNYAGDLGSGKFGATGLVSYLDTLETTVPGAPSVDRAGDIGASGTPHWSGSLLLNYSQGAWDFYLQERFIGSGSYDNTLPPNSLADDKVDPVFYTDITAKYAFDAGIGKAELFGTVNNLFDKDPPIVPFSPYGVYRSTNPGLYDVVGRYFTVGFKLRF
tara:strand:+ start:10208 stop:12970 length:2763 start_codon:yes stop_codon:yes gene_type:complete